MWRMTSMTSSTSDQLTHLVNWIVYKMHRWHFNQLFWIWPASRVLFRVNRLHCPSCRVTSRQFNVMNHPQGVLPVESSGPWRWVGGRGAGWARRAGLSAVGELTAWTNGRQSVEDRSVYTEHKLTSAAAIGQVTQIDHRSVHWSKAIFSGTYLARSEFRGKTIPTRRVMYTQWWQHRTEQIVLHPTVHCPI